VPRWGDTASVSLVELLDRPRQELAALADEWTAQAKIREKATRDNQGLTFLPELRLPLVVPVWREATYSEAAGFSLPPYLKASQKDNACALHLARFGDVEAAMKLAEDDATRRQVEACRLTRNYPVEWTRLAALTLHVAQQRLASGDPEGGAELVALHRQLGAALDPQAAQGPLGADLLARGPSTLTRAAPAWRTVKRPELAEAADAALAGWGTAPPPVVAVKARAPRAEVARVLGDPGKKYVAVAPTASRALDLFGLPFPGEGVQAVSAFFDPWDRLGEVLVTYRPRLAEWYPEPANLAQVLEDHGLASADAEPVGGLRRRTYTLGGLPCEVALVPRGNVLGAYVRLGEAGITEVKLPRDFGAVCLDRSFEQNRVRLAPQQTGDTVSVQRAQTLAELSDPVHRLDGATGAESMKLTGLLVQRQPPHDVVSALTLRYAEDQKMPALHEMARALWTAYGPGQFEAGADEHGGYVGVAWQDLTTRYLLRLPYAAGQPPEFIVADRRGPGQADERVAAVAAKDDVERRERLAAGKPLVRLPRHVEVEGIQLGTARDEVAQWLPRGQAVLKQEYPGMIGITWAGEASQRATHVARQMFLRFDASGRLAEVRVRYQDGPASRNAAGGWATALLNGYRKQCGAAHETPAPGAEVWADLRQQPPGTLHRWQDDLTRMAVRRDGAGLEITLRDRPRMRDEGAPLPSFAYLPRGPENCQIGDVRADLLKRWNVTKPTTTRDDALVLHPANAGPHDALLVWFDKDRVVRVVARHAQAAPSRAKPAEMTRALMEAWGREGHRMGWPTLQVATPDGALQQVGWVDDGTRMRVFWEESPSGPPRLFTEWKGL
jgi:hypothetical protein